jgi:hypothetical protein
MMIETDWSDKRNRKARWEQKIIAELNLIVPLAVASEIIVGYMHAHPRARALFEEVDKRLKRRARYIPRPTWRRLF